MSAKPSFGVHRIPPEILLRIFDDFVKDYQSDPTYHSLRTNQGAWTIGKVCHGWRVAVQDAPGLWNNIYCFLNWSDMENKPGPIPDERWENSVDIIALQLSWSQNVPLTIRLEAFAPTPGLPKFTALTKLVFEQHRRWRSFHLRDDTNTICNALAISPSTPMNCPRLEELGLNMTSESEGFRGPFTKDGCSSLRSVRLHRNLRVISSPAFASLWPQIEMLELGFAGKSLDLFVNHLHQFSNLTSLTIYGCFRGFERGVILPAPYLLPRLTTFISTASPSENILDNITAPALEHLDLYSSRRSLHFSLNVKSITALIARSRCSIKFFRCTCGGMKFEELSSVLNAMGELDHLSLIIGGDDLGEIAQGLSRQLPESPFRFCPRLSHLEITLGYEPSHYGAHALVTLADVIESRSRALDAVGEGEVQSYLRKVELEILSLMQPPNYRLPDKVKESMIDLKRSGLDIVLRGFDRDDVMGERPIDLLS